MLPKVVLIAICLGLMGASVASSQTLSGIDGPAEPPAEDYEGESYVDSQGCAFVRAGYGGQTKWVPQVSADRKAICGQTPTQLGAGAAETPASSTEKPKPAGQTAKAAPAARPGTASRVKVGCPVSSPVARRYATTDGGSVVLCTARNGSLTGARSPIYPPGSPVGAALSAKAFPGVDIPLGELAAIASEIDGGDGVNPPKGYEKAWKDDRLNPARGIPAATQAQSATAQEPSVTAKATDAATSGKLFVQVGAFAEPGNADGASVRLKGLGLPVSRGKFVRNGKTLQVIYAGPFASASEAQSALAAARGNGFSDAFIR